MGTIVVTGSTGTIGSAVVERLVERGARVRAASRSVGATSDVATAGVEHAVLDYDRPATFDRVLDGAERVLIVAPDGPDHAPRVGAFAAAAKRAGVRHVVQISSIQADPTISLARWTREAETEVALTGIDTTVLRPTSFMQNFSRMLAQGIRSDGVIALPFGTGRVSWIDARDVAAVAAALLVAPAHVGETLDLTGSAALATGDVAAIFGAVLGREITYVDLPLEVARQGMAAMGLAHWAVSATCELFEACRGGRMADVSPAVTRLLGRAPTDLAGFVRDHRAAFVPAPAPDTA